MTKEIRTENLIVEVEDENELKPLPKNPKVIVKITPMKSDVNEIIYKTEDERGNEYILKDEKGKITIENAYQILATGGDDVDWDFRSILPCEKCERVEEFASKDRFEREKAEKENEGLRKILRDIINLMN